MRAVSEKDLVRSGSFGTLRTSAQAGYLPVPLRYVPSTALREIPIFIRGESGRSTKREAGAYVLYRGVDQPFNLQDRQRLIDHDVQFVYIRITDQSRFREQTELALVETAADPRRAVSERSEIVYQTSVELVNELMAEPDVDAQSARLERVSRAVTTLVLGEPGCFSHLFAVSSHDFYTATHMVNVATWMVALAYALGRDDPKELACICRAGLLHDIGKIFVPEAILNKPGRLSADEWEAIRRHPQLGYDHLAAYPGIEPLIRDVVLRHHERLDGSGYPAGLGSDQIDPISRLCAVVDTFDAMTAQRPFKKTTLAVPDAVVALKRLTPHHLDPQAVEAWLGLLRTTEEDGNQESAAGSQRAGNAVAAAPPPDAPGWHGPRLRGPAKGAGESASIGNSDGPSPSDRRRAERLGLHCEARVHLLSAEAGARWHEQPGLQATIHNVSRWGIGFLSRVPVEPGRYVRIHLLGRQWGGRLVHGMTVRCRAYRDHWYEIGVALTPEDEAALTS